MSEDRGRSPTHGLNIVKKMRSRSASNKSDKSTLARTETHDNLATLDDKQTKGFDNSNQGSDIFKQRLEDRLAKGEDFSYELVQDIINKLKVEQNSTTQQPIVNPEPLKYPPTAPELRHSLRKEITLQNVRGLIPNGDKLNFSEAFLAVLSDVKGGIAFQNWATLNPLLAADVKNVESFCNEYYKGMQEEKLQQQYLKNDLRKEMETLLKEEREKIEQKMRAEIKLESVNELLCKRPKICDIDLPTFPSEPLNLSGKHFDNCLNYFPTKRRWGGPIIRNNEVLRPVQEFLTDMVVGQCQARLSEENFREFLLKSSEGDAREYFVEISQDCKSIEELFCETLAHYDLRVTPEDAMRQLQTYKAAKNRTCREVIHDVRLLLKAASRLYHLSTLRQEFIDEQGPQILMKTLPFQSKVRLETEYNRLMRRIGRRPTFHEIKTLLRNEEDSINSEIRTSGVDKSQQPPISLIRSDKIPQKKTNFSFPRHRVNAITTSVDFNKKGENGKNGKTKFKQWKGAGGNFSDREGKFCELCKSKGHGVGNTCQLMFNDFGHPVEQTVSQGPCTICQEKLNIEILHPPKYCFIRDKAIELYKNGTVKIQGYHVRKYLDKIGVAKMIPDEEYKNQKRQKNLNNKHFNKTNYNNNYKRSDNNSREEWGASNDDIEDGYDGQAYKMYVRTIYSVSNLIDANKTASDKCYLIDTKRQQTCKMLYVNLVTNHKILGKHILTAMYDSGSSNSLITASYICKALNINLQTLKQMVKKSAIQLSSYSNHKIDLLGCLAMPFFLPTTKKLVTLELLVIDDRQANYSPFLIGLKGVALLDLEMTHKINNKNVKTPALVSCHDEQRKSLSVYASDDKLRLARGFITHLEPDKTIHVKVSLQHNYDFHQHKVVLITNDFFERNNKKPFLYIIPSICKLELNNNTTFLEGIVAVKNNSNIIITNTNILVTVECAESYNVKDFNCKNFENLSKINFIHELDNYCSIVGKTDKCNKINVNNKFEKKTAFSFKSSKTIEPIPSHVYEIQTLFPDNPNIKPCPKSINNGMKKKESVSESRLKIETNKGELTEKEIKDFNNPEKSCQLSVNYYENEEFEKNLTNQRGYELPTELPDGISRNSMLHIESLVNLDQYEPHVRKYVKSIFLEQFPNLISTSSLQRGNMSETLGKYKIRLKDNVTLPKHKKVYYLSPLETRQLQAILEYLINNGTISKAKNSGDLYHDFSSPGYIIPRSKPEASPRLIINFINLNKVIKSEPAVLPTVDSMIAALRQGYLFSVVDLSNAFYSIEISDDSKPLTGFTCALGSFYHNCLPTGIKTSPESLNRFVSKAIHWLPKKNDKGEEIWDNGELEMFYDPIKECMFIYDDIIMYSPPKLTYKESVDAHFEIVQKVMQRLNRHKCKIGVQKSQIAKTKVNFFGYYISNKTVFSDPKRIEKVLKAPFPTTPTQLRSFLGIINSMRSQLGHDTICHTSDLTELTSGKQQKFKLNPKQEKAFDNIKHSLTQGPIYSNIIDIRAPKVIFSDMSGSDNACYSAVLGQIIVPKEGEITVPDHLNLEDPCHAILYDLKIMAKPLPLKSHDITLKEYLKNLNEIPSNFDYLNSDTLGYTKETVTNSLKISLELLYEVSGCSFDIENITKNLYTMAKNTLKRDCYLNFVFNNKKDDFFSFLDRLKGGIFDIDEKLYIFEMLAEIIYRPIVVITALTGYKKITEFNADKKKPPFYFLLYNKNDTLLVRPAIADKISSYKLANLRGTLEIVAYISKVINQKDRHLHIIDLELQGILFALSSFRKLVGNSECLLLTDSQALFYLFNSTNLQSNKKMSRWNFQIIESYPQLQIKHCISAEQLADFLTRQYKVDNPPIKKLKLNRFKNDIYDEMIPDITFSLNEWKEFVDQHSGFIFSTLDLKETEKINLIQTAPQIKAATMILNPIQILKKRLDTEIIYVEQKKEFQTLINKCNISKNQSIEIDEKVYLLSNGLLCIKIKEDVKLVCPETLLPIFIAYAHLLTNHGGENKIRLNLQNLYHKKLIKFTRLYTRSCYGCQLTNSDTHPNVQGIYPIPPKPFYLVHFDYIQNLPTYRQYKHVLVCTCYLTGAIYAYPVTTLDSSEFIKIFLFNVYQLLSPCEILMDNATTFINKEVLVLFAALNIKVHYTTSYNPKSKGCVERSNLIIKQAILKTVGQKTKFNWMYMLPIITRIYNSTVLPKHKFAPIDLLFGIGTAQKFNHFDMLPSKQLHPLVGSEYKAVLKQHEELKSCIKNIKDSIQKTREDRINKINKTKIDKNFKVDQLVLVKKHGHILGQPTTLKHVYQLSPYRVLSTASVSLIAERITDGHQIKISNDDAKSFKLPNDEFRLLPVELQSVLFKSFHDLTDEDIRTFIRNDTFCVPETAMQIDIKKYIPNDILSQVLQNVNSVDNFHADMNLNEIQHVNIDANIQTNDNQNVQNTNLQNESSDSETDEPHSYHLRPTPRPTVRFDM